MKNIYLDNAATMPVYSEVVKEMEKTMIDNYGNPSSTHELGEKARIEIDNARKVIARELGGRAEEIIFTSGATESNNLAILGLAKANNGVKKKIIISSIEHSSVLEVCEALKAEGYEIVEIPVDKEGFVGLKRLEEEIDSKTLLVSVIHANNEIGVLQDLRKIGALCKRKGVLFHTDAVQSFGRERINVRDFGIDLLSASGHKIGGPKGIGFLFIRQGVDIKPIMYGGGQERWLRVGTENVPGIAGFAKALEITKKIDEEKVRKVRDYFMIELEKMGGKINGSREKRAAGNVHVSFSGLDADYAVIKLSQKGIMCSTGSACESKRKGEKRILKAIGLNEKEIAGSLRFGLREGTGKKDIDFVVGEIGKIV